jgi:adenylate kinase family enzyme
MKRVAIIGSGGSGKSTLARRLGSALALPVIHLDALYWKPGWVETPWEEWARIQEEVVGRDRWVIDGNYGGTIDIRLEAADTIVFLDLPRSLCLWNIVKRRLRYAGRSRPDMGAGCEERLTWAFVRWVWDYPATRRPGILRTLARYAPGRRVVRLRSGREIDEFLTRATREALRPHAQPTDARADPSHEIDRGAGPCSAGSDMHQSRGDRILEREPDVAEDRHLLAGGATAFCGDVGGSSERAM